MNLKKKNCTKDPREDPIRTLSDLRSEAAFCNKWVWKVGGNRVNITQILKDKNYN